MKIVILSKLLLLFSVFGISEKEMAIEMEANLTSSKRCVTACSTWTYDMGFQYGCIMSNWSYRTYRDRLNYYQNTCNCFEYAVGIREGYQNCYGPDGEPTNNDGNNDCNNPDGTSGPCPQ